MASSCCHGLSVLSALRPLPSPRAVPAAAGARGACALRSGRGQWLGGSGLKPAGARVVSGRGFDWQQSRRQHVLVTCAADGKKDKKADIKYSSQMSAQLRTEATAPFRTFRMFLYLAFMGSAGLGGTISLVRTLTSALGAPAANTGLLQDNLVNLAVDAGAFLLFFLLYRSDSKSKDKQLARITREETMGELKVELTTGKVISLEQLRGSARVLLLAGDYNYVKQALDAAEQYKDALVERGVTIVPLVLPPNAPQTKELAVTDDKRWKAAPVVADKWVSWIAEQKRVAGVAPGSPVYISLRLDGRVRGSGVGIPPWQQISVALPPMKGFFQGPLDGLDGRV
eukprot:jgi/Chlat1/3248/Chrsp22S03517